MMKNAQNKIIISVVIAVIVTFALSFLFLKYIPDNKEMSKITNIRKAFLQELYANTAVL